MSCVTCHVSHVTCYMTPVKCHVSHVPFFLTKCWCLLVEGLLSTRPNLSSFCEFKDIKLCKLKIKLIALGWNLVNRMFRCQTNPEIHCSPHTHPPTPKNLLYKLVKELWKFTIFGSLLVQFFLIPCVCTCISFKIQHTADTNSLNRCV